MKVKRFTPYIIFLVAFAYYGILCAKEFTWIFVSADSGQWLASSTAWIVPQPMGSPLYVFLGHALNLLPGDLALKMAVGLSSFPAAITVAVVYLIAYKLTSRFTLALVASLIVLGCGIFLTQSTVLEEYALATCFLTVAFWFYLNGSWRLTALMLGLGTAVHFVLLPVAILWLIVERKRWRQLTSAMGIYILAGLVPYCYVFILMILQSPPVTAGYFGWSSIERYFTDTGGIVFGTISIYDFPLRIGHYLQLIVTCFGLALAPLAYYFWKQRRGYNRIMWLIIAVVGFFTWYYITSLDPVTWTFYTFATPFIAIGVVMALNHLKRSHMVAVGLCAVMLIVSNGVFLNGAHLARADLEPREYVEELRSLPDGSAVVTYAGAHGVALLYEITKGKDLVPIIFLRMDKGWWSDYGVWLREEYDIQGNTTQELARDAMLDGREVYVAGERWTKEEGYTPYLWEEMIICFDIIGNGTIRKLEGFSCEWNLEDFK